jgi:hypothetical protein
MRTRFSPWVRAATAGLAIVALAGCAGVSGDNEPKSAAARVSAPMEGAMPRVELRKGMVAEEVRLALGNPLRIQPVEVAKGKAETWIYELDRKSEVRQVVAGSRDVPYFDPFLNETRMIPEPVYAYETTTITAELHLSWENGELIAWRTESRSDRSLTR